MDGLRQLIQDNDTWLMERILRYAKERDYTRYTSTLKEAWRLSISDTSASLLCMLDRDPGQWEFGPDDDFSNDPAAAFGVREAKLHRRRGISISMFLGLLKYYRQTYLELVADSDLDPECKARSDRLINRFFNRVEIALSREWSSTDAESVIQELQAGNRDMTNEKNKFLTIFESIPNPVVIVDMQDRVTDLNTAASRMAEEHLRPGSGYYMLADSVGIGAGRGSPEKGLGRGEQWLKDLLGRFNQSNEAQYSEELKVPTTSGERTYQAHMTYMADISGKFSGKVIVLEDVTARRRVQGERLAREKLQAVVETAGAACHELNQPLQAMMAALELAIFEAGDADPVRARLETIKKEMERLVNISHGLRRITEHHTKPYLNDVHILDIKKSSRRG